MSMNPTNSPSLNTTPALTTAARHAPHSDRLQTPDGDRSDEDENDLKKN